MLRDAIVYVRVSTTAQATGGLSIPDQIKQAQEYARLNGLRIVQLFRDDGVSASKAGVRRRGFEAMVAYLRANPQVRDLLTEKINRTTRNTPDFAELDGLRSSGVRLHNVRDRRVYGPDSAPADLMLMEIEVAQAKFDSRNLALEVKKGQRERADLGFYSTPPPRGYEFPKMRTAKSVLSPTIVPSPEAPIVVELFQYYLKHDVGFRAVAKFVAELGLVAKTGRPLSETCVRDMLRNRVYIGELPRLGAWLPGAHEPIVPRDLFDAVQQKMETRSQPGGSRRGPVGARAYNGMLTCARCGASVVHEPPRSTGRHLYHAWHCSSPSCDGRAFVDEVYVDAAMMHVLRLLDIPKTLVAESIARVLAPSAPDEQRTTSLRRRVGSLDCKLDKAREALMDSRCDAETRGELFADMTRMRDERAAAQRELDEHLGSVVQRERGADVALAAVDLLRELPDLYAAATPEERRELVTLLLAGSGDRSRWSARCTGRAPGRGGKRIFAGTIAPAWRECWLPFARVRTLLCAPACRAARTA